jgi:indolepyruvate ferredoxin oxidoreductase beta subunit
MEDTRMQNMALLGTVAKHRHIPGVTKENYNDALEDLMAGEMLRKNRVIFDVYAS